MCPFLSCCILLSLYLRTYRVFPCKFTIALIIFIISTPPYKSHCPYSPYYPYLLTLLSRLYPLNLLFVVFLLLLLPQQSIPPLPSFLFVLPFCRPLTDAIRWAIESLHILDEGGIHTSPGNGMYGPAKPKTNLHRYNHNYNHNQTPNTGKSQEKPFKCEP